MYNKNIDNNLGNQTDSLSNTHKNIIYDKVNEIDTKKRILRNCSITANAIIHNLYISRDDSNLLGLLGCSSTAKNNYDAICEWIYKKKPDLIYIDKDIIKEFQNGLIDALNESRNYYY